MATTIFSYDPLPTTGPLPSTMFVMPEPVPTYTSTNAHHSTVFVVPEPAPTTFSYVHHRSTASVEPEPTPTVSISTASVEPTSTIRSTAAPSSDLSWYQRPAAGPLTYILLVYCFASLFLLGTLLHTGVLGLDLEINFEVLRRRYNRRHYRPRSRDRRDSIALTELGDPDRDMQRQWEAEGIRVSDEELEAQRTAYQAAMFTDRTVSQPRPYEQRRQQQDAEIMRRMREAGLL